MPADRIISYVRCLFIDYSRAFDIINHELLIRKLLSLATPSEVVRWIVNFLTGRTQAVSLDGKLSNWLPITQSIVQGSGIGPILFIIFASDLKLRFTMNLLCKYADDITLMIPQNTDVCIEDEFKHVMQWSVQNKLIINLTKTKEMAFHLPGSCRFIAPPPLVDIECVAISKLPGIYILLALCPWKRMLITFFLQSSSGCI
jgi:Reverse transcriptase (RNA-dependent DNA polymerase)